MSKVKENDNHSQWLNETLNTMSAIKKSKEKQKSKKLRSGCWNKRIVKGSVFEEYDSTKDKYCPLRFNKKSKRRRRISKAIDFAMNCLSLLTLMVSYY